MVLFHYQQSYLFREADLIALLFLESRPANFSGVFLGRQMKRLRPKVIVKKPEGKFEVNFPSGLSVLTNGDLI